MRMAECSEIEASLEERWDKLTSFTDPEVRQKWWKIIVSQYTEPSRKYHTLAHLHKMFEHLDEYISEISSPKALSFAIFFHDIFYDVQSHINEENSARKFEEFAAESGLDKDEELTASVKELIHLSKSHLTDEHKSVDVYGKDDVHYFLDFDLSILGMKPSEYKEYASKIRDEYSYLPESKYNLLRVRVLKSFVLIPNIFATKLFREKYEETARINIEHEISELEKGI